MEKGFYANDLLNISPSCVSTHTNRCVHTHVGGHLVRGGRNLTTHEEGEGWGEGPPYPGKERSLGKGVPHAGRVGRTQKSSFIEMFICACPTGTLLFLLSLTDTSRLECVSKATLIRWDFHFLLLSLFTFCHQGAHYPFPIIASAISPPACITCCPRE